MALKKSIWQETSLVNTMKRRNRPVRALINGASAIRNNIENKNGDNEPSLTEYILKEEKEPEKAYKNRLLRTYVTPYTTNAISSATGEIFKNPLQINSGESEAQLPDRLYPVLSNVDLIGSDFNEWVMRATEESFSYGMAIGFVDYYNQSESENLSEQISSGARPYLKLVSYFDLLGYSFDESGRITMLRFMEEAEIEDDVLGADRVEQVRIVRPTSYEVYRKNEKGEPELTDSGEIERFDDKGARITDSVPCVVMYGRKLGTLNAASVFEDMAYINLQHTQVNSDLSWASHFYLIPFLFTTRGEDGVSDGAPVISTLASHINIELEHGADIKWVETNGNAQKAGSEFLAAIEKRIEISKMDSSVSVMSGAKETATGRAIDAKGTTAKLKLHAEAVESFAKELLKTMVTFMPDVTLPDIEVVANKDFSVNMDGQTVAELRSSVVDGLLTVETYLKEIKRRGVLGDDIDIAIEIENIKQESALSGMA